MHGENMKLIDVDYSLKRLYLAALRNEQGVRLVRLEVKVFYVYFRLTPVYNG
jgi:hypothetical protein